MESERASKKKMTMQAKEAEKTLEAGTKKINFTFDSNGKILHKKALNVANFPP